jgi:beta-N-acetylhexosaminidase
LGGRTLARLGLYLVVVVLSGLVTIGQTSPAPRLPRAVAHAYAPLTTTETWDLDADIGSVMVLSWRGAVDWSVVHPVLTRYQVGGVLLFTANFGGYPSDLKFWTDRINVLASNNCSAHPILTMLDEEGGELANVKASFAPPWPMVMAASGPDRVRELERINGAGLHDAGVGLNLAPVADVRTNPRDGIIGLRSFGSDPSVVAPLVGAAVSGLHEGGVGATVKHFPGLGGAAGDPHVAIPTDDESESQWTRVQLPAFQAGIAAGADAVMVTAVYTPGLGSGSMPALFSPAIIGRLRIQLGFDGVIVTDSLSMWGIGQKWSLPEAAVLSLAAGNDMVLLGNGDPSYEVQAMEAVRAAVLSGRLDRTRLHESAIRVNALRDRWGREPVPCTRPAAA